MPIPACPTKPTRRVSASIQWVALVQRATILNFPIEAVKALTSKWMRDGKNGCLFKRNQYTKYLNP